MSEEQQPRIVHPEATTECATCGHVPGPFEACTTCHGRAQVQSRAFTRTEEQRGANSDPGRYGSGGNVNPKIVSLPGSDARFGGKP